MLNDTWNNMFDVTVKYKPRGSSEAQQPRAKRQKNEFALGLGEPERQMYTTTSPNSIEGDSLPEPAYPDLLMHAHRQFHIIPVILTLQQIFQIYGHPSPYGLPFSRYMYRYDT
jgi:hypothetical protein